jgi:AAA family ATP:ADP antiporter
VVRRLLALRPEERRGTVAAFLTIFGTLAAHTLLETARDALFLARLPAPRLAVVYLLIAFVAVGLAQVPWGRRRATGAFALSRLLGLGAVVTFLFWALGRWQSPLELYALYVWTGLLGSLAVLQFWMVLGDLYTLAQAKRLYSLVWTGSLLGATVGAAAARLLADRAPTSTLVLAAAALFGLTALGPALALGRAEGRSTVRPRGGASMAEGIAILKGDAYVRSLAVLVLVSTIALTLGDYVFKSAVARSVPKEELGAFFGGFYALLNLLALAAQVVLGGWLFRAIGLHRALWVLPALLFVGAAGVALGGGLVAALLLKVRTAASATGPPPGASFTCLADTVGGQPALIDIGQRQAAASLLIRPRAYWRAAMSCCRGVGRRVVSSDGRVADLSTSTCSAPRFGRGHCVPRWTFLPWTSSPWRPSSARSTARTTTRWWRRWTCWPWRAARGSSPRSSSTTRRKGSSFVPWSSSRSTAGSTFSPWPRG